MSTPSSSNGPGLSLHVTIYLAPENVPKFLEYFKPIFDKVTAEPECRFFELYQSEEEPGTLTWVEDWAATKEWLMTKQLTKEYYKEYFAATEPMFVKPREFKILNRVGPQYFVAKE